MRRDDVARLLNQDAFEEAARLAIGSAASGGESVTVLSMEVDSTGGPGGSAPRSELVQLLCRNLRSRDAVARGAGGELLILLQGTPLAAAQDVAERLAGAVRTRAEWTNVDDPARSTAASIGIAAAPQHGSSFNELLGAARNARVEMARSGGDGSAVAKSPSGEPEGRRLEIGRFTGRTDQLRALVRLLDEASAGVPRVAVITGEVGAGSSALARQLASEVRLRGGSLIAAECRAAEIVPPYGVWSGLLEQLHRLPSVPKRKWNELPALYPPLGADAANPPRGGSQYRLFGEMSQMIRGAASRQPLVIVFEEMQRADPASLDALEHVLAELGSARVLCLLTVRSERIVDPERRSRIDRIRADAEIHLSRLTRDEVKNWMEAALGHQDIGRDLLSFVYRHTEGNPLSITHLLRYLVDEGALAFNDDGWRWAKVPGLRLPDTLCLLLEARVRRLPPGTRRVLLFAALLGREFDATLMVEAGAGTETEVLEGIGAAVEAGLLEPRGMRRSGAYGFTHSAIGEALLVTADSEDVSLGHAALARSLEGRGDSDYGELALHHHRGGAAAAAFASATEAARRADRLYAPAIATEYLRLAIRSAETPAELADAREMLAMLAERVGRYDEAEELCDLAIVWHHGQGDLARSIALRLMRERVRSQLGQPAQTTLEALRSLDEEASHLGLRKERVAILTLLSQVYGRIGDRRSAERIAGECVEMAERIGEPTLLANSLNRYAITLGRDEWERARETYHRVLRLYDETADTRGQARANINLGVLLQLHGHLGQAEDALVRAIAIAKTAGLPDQWGLAALNLGVMVMNCGAFDRARELFSEALSLFATVKSSEYQLYALYNLAHLERVQGNFESACGLYEVASSLARRVGQVDVELGALGGAGFCRFATGHTEEAQRALVVIEAATAGREEWFQGRELIEALRIALALEEGEIDRGRALFDDALVVAEERDLYGAAWLAATLGSTLEDRGVQVGPTVERLRARATELGLNVTERTEPARRG